MNKNQSIFREYIDLENKVLSKVDFESIDKIIRLINKVWVKDGFIASAGNGGSGLNATNIVADWGKILNNPGSKPLKTICFNDNIAALSAYSNDFSYEEVFSKQVENYLTSRDLFICFSGSGSSPNIINALSKCNELGVETIAFLGYDGGKAIDLTDNSLLVPSFDMQIVENIHLRIVHFIMKILCDKSLFTE